jgi:RluA family pseudouridine synthase
MITIPVTPDNAGTRLDRIVRKNLPLRPLSDIYRLLRTGAIRVNGKKSQQNYRLCEGDILEMDVDAAELPSKEPHNTRALIDLTRTDFFKRNLNILFEDGDLLACDKPPGLVVHPGTGHAGNDTLIDLVKSYMAAKKNVNPEEPVLVHRIDRDTSGVILIAKNKRMLRYLHTHFRDHQIEKTYVAVCHGRPPKNKGVIETNLQKSVEKNSGTKMTVHETGMYSKSEYSVARSNAAISLVHVTIGTGRTHQIRVHLAHIGCPIVGDVRYGNKALDLALFARKGVDRRLYLHAAHIGFTHPIDGKKRTLSAPLPDAFLKIMKTVE